MPKTYIQKFQLIQLVKQWYYQTVQYGVVKNPDLLKTKMERIIKNISKVPMLGDILMYTYKKWTK